MRPLQFVFALIKEHVPMDNAERLDLQEEIMKDYENIPYSAESLKKPDATIKMKLKAISENPYVRLVFAIIYIPASRFLSDYIAGVEDPSEQEENKRKGLL